MKKLIVLFFLVAVPVMFFTELSCTKDLDECEKSMLDKSVYIAFKVNMNVIYSNDKPYTGPVHYFIRKEYCDGRISGSFTFDLETDENGDVIVPYIFGYKLENYEDKIFQCAQFSIAGENFEECREYSYQDFEDGELGEILFKVELPLSPAMPEKPHSFIPRDWEDGVDCLPMLHWECNAPEEDKVTYEIRLYDYYDFYSYKILAEGISEKHYQLKEYQKLEPNKLYQWEVIATNRYSLTGRSGKITLETMPEGDVFLDERDFTYYKIIHVAGKTWFAENLRYATPDSYYIVDDTSYCIEYGRLYTWEAAKTACPPGWHLSTDKDWSELEQYLGMSQFEADSVSGWRGTNQGHRLKAKDTWDHYGGGSDEIGFAALAGGRVEIYSDSYQFRGHNDEGYWWTADNYPDYPDRVYYRRLSFSEDGVYRSTQKPTTNGFSVRCVKD
jgi:uncharacterized protein (TIGR02145 family)